MNDFVRGFEEIGLGNATILRSESFLGTVVSIIAVITSLTVIPMLARVVVERAVKTVTPVRVRFGGLIISVPGEYSSYDQSTKAISQLAEALSDPSSDERGRITVGLDEIEPITSWPRRSKKRLANALR